MGNLHGNTLNADGTVNINPDNPLGTPEGTPQASHNNARHFEGCDQVVRGAEADSLYEED